MTRIVFFFQPLVWWLRGRLRLDQDYLADAAAARQSSEPEDYAEFLAARAARRLLAPAVAGLGIGDRKTILTRRVLMLVSNETTLEVRCPRIWRLGVLAAALLIIAAVGTFGGFMEEDARAEAAKPSSESATADSPTEPASTEPQEATTTEDQERTEANVARISTSGKVVDANGKPIVGATVYLREWAHYRFGGDPFNWNPDEILTKVETAEDGAFQFENVPTRPSLRYRVPWDIVVVAEGRGMAWRHSLTTRNDSPMTLTLPPEAKVMGWIVDKQGNPISGVEVEVAGLTGLGSRIRDRERSPHRLDLWRSRLAPKVLTDAEGGFTIGGLTPERRVELVVSHDDYARTTCYAATTDRLLSKLSEDTFRQGKRHVKTYRVHTGDFTVTLEPGYHVSGRVVYADTQQPIAEAKVALACESRAFHATADVEGRFFFHGLSQPAWHLMAVAPRESDYVTWWTPVPLSSGDSRTVEVKVELPRGEEITGSVVDKTTGEGVSHVSVMFRSDRPEDAPSFVFARPRLTGDDGTFRVVAPPGKGTLSIQGGKDYDLYGREGPDGKPDPRFVRSLEVKLGEPIRGVRFRVGRGLVINGLVSDPQGKPVPDAEVKALRRPYGYRHAVNTRTDEQGRFTFSGFRTKAQVILMVKHPARKWLGRACVKTDPRAGDLRTVSVECRLQPAAAVKGRVLVDTRPMAGVRVSLNPMGPTAYDPYGYRGEEGLTNDTGNFQFDVFPLDDECRISCSTDGSSMYEPSLSFRPKPGQTHDLGTLTAWTGHKRVSGIVVDREGNPLEDAEVTVCMRDGRDIPNAYTLPVCTAKHGRFKIMGVPNVPLSVKAKLRNPPDPKSGFATIRSAVTVDAMPGETNLRIVLDPNP